MQRDDGGERAVGRGWTQPGGRPHAETVALARAGGEAVGADAYVTLEPCAHHGETGPCADALITAGVARVVVAAQDPDPRVAGNGIARMRDAGIAVEVGCCASEARRVNAGFLCRIEKGRPFVALKLATSLDGKIAARTGHSQWITGPQARARGHLLRARFDAVLTGGGTVAADDPSLTCRLAGLEERTPLRVIMAGAGGIERERQVITTAADVATLIYTARDRLEAGAADVQRVEGDATGRPIPAAVLADLAVRGVTRVLVEAGPGIAAAFAAAGCIDEIHWFRAPCVIGGDGLSAFGALHHDTVDDLARFSVCERLAVGDDTYDVLHRTDE